MQTRTIPQEDWTRVFDSLSRIYEGETASLELLTPDMGAQFEVEEQPFRGISYDPSGIELMFSVRGTHFVHRIAKPKAAQIEEDDAALMSALGVDAEDDVRRVVRFHAPQPSKLLPAE